MLESTPTHHTQRLFIRKNGTLGATPAACSGSLASDRHGGFVLTHTFDRDTHIGKALTVRCWMDAPSAERGHFVASLGQRACHADVKWGEADRALPCITGHTQTACCGEPQKKRLVELAIVTTPTLYKAGQTLILTVTLGAPKGSEAIMRGTMYVGGAADSAVLFDACMALAA